MKKTFLIVVITSMFFMTGCNEVNSSSSTSSTSSSGQITGTVD